ncbi:acyl-CoA dehydrogenase, partial [Mycobacterium sp. ITM-2017-0098]
ERDIPAVSVLKVLGSEAEQNAMVHALDAAGVDGLLDPALTASFNPYAPDIFTASWFARYVTTYAGTIAGGTSEIQRNIIAQRVLG